MKKLSSLAVLVAGVVVSTSAMGQWSAETDGIAADARDSWSPVAPSVPPSPAAVPAAPPGYVPEASLGQDLSVLYAMQYACRDECQASGRCWLSDSGCVARHALDCYRAEICREHGRCDVREGRCVASTEAMCHASRGCREGDDCFLQQEDGVCEAHRANKGALAAGIAMTAVGGAGIVLGAVALILRDFGDGYAVGGGIGVGGGALLVAIGIPLMVAGMDHERPFGLPPAVSVEPGGLTLRF